MPVISLFNIVSRIQSRDANSSYRRPRTHSSFLFLSFDLPLPNPPSLTRLTVSAGSIFATSRPKDARNCLVKALEIYQAVVFPSRVENGLRWAVLFLYL